MVSVIVPVFNTEKYLDRCIDSIINQTYSNLEILLIDDGSTDSSGLICDQYKEFDNRIKVFHISNRGLSEARNLGLRIAVGKYILFIDSDDYIEMDSIERLLTGILDKNIDFVMGNYREIDQNYSCDKVRNGVQPYFPYSSPEIMKLLIQNKAWYPAAYLNLYRKDFLINNTLFFRKGFYYEDLELLPRLFFTANRIVYVDYIFYNYIIRENSIMTSGTTLEKRNHKLIIYKDWFRLFKKVEDSEWQRLLYGMLVSSYLWAVRYHKITSWAVEGLDYSFAKKYALNNLDRAKAMVFHYFPWLYIRLKKINLKKIIKNLI